MKVARRQIDRKLLTKCETMAGNDYQDIFRQMEHLTDEVFRGFFERPTRSVRFWQPHVDIHENETALQVNVELPGVRAEDITVSLSADDRLLTIAGVRKEAEGQREGRVRCHQLEIYFGPFERTMQIPQHIRVERDSMKASYREGFLFVTLPKQIPSGHEATKIPVTVADSTTEVSAESRVNNDRE